MTPRFRHSAYAQLEQHLCAHGRIRNARVLEKSQPCGKSAPVAYIVPKGVLDTDQLASEFKSLPDCPAELVFVQISRLPIKEDGSCDDEALIGLPVIDDDLLNRAEEAARHAVGAAHAVALPCESPTVTPLHVSKLYSNWKWTGEEKTAERADEGSKTALGRDAQSLAVGAPLNRASFPAQNLFAALGTAADTQNGVTVIDGHGAAKRIAYNELLNKAARIHAGLAALGLRPGDKALFQFRDNFDFLVAFWACQRLGVAVSPIGAPPSYDLQSTQFDTLRHAWRLLDKPVILTAASDKKAIADACANADMKGARIAALSELEKAGSAPEPADPSNTDVALILFTSGSTGAPKGVMLSHENVISRSIASIQFDGFGETDISLNWMPLDHVGGIVMFHIRDVLARCEQLQVATDYILSDVTRWFDLIDKYRATITWAPNFAFALANDKADQLATMSWDLRCLRFILNGGEAVSSATARRFLKLYGRCGLPETAMRPAWGMSETSSGVTSSHDFHPDINRDEDAFVSVGGPLPGVRIKIVDERGDVAPEGVEGRLFITGPTVTAGYFKNEEENRKSFDADGWFSTGDLGVLEDGKLSITGRQKNIIIINGLNYNCHEIETEVDSLPGVKTSYSAAAAVRDSGSDTDELAVFFAPESFDTDDMRRTLCDIRTVLQKRFGLKAAYIIPLKPEQIPKTSIGKIQRIQLRDALANGSFDQELFLADRLIGGPRTLPAWFFTQDWAPTTSTTEPGDALADTTILAFIRDDDFSDAFVDKLKRAGARVIQISEGARFTHLGEDAFEASPESSDDIRRILDTIGEGVDLSAAYLWAYAGPVANASRIRKLNSAAIDQSITYPRAILQALVRYSKRRVRFIAAVARPAAVAGDEYIDPSRAALAGYMRSWPQDCADLDTTHINLEGIDPTHDADCAFREFCQAGRERDVAYRAGVRLSRILQPALDRKEDPEILQDALSTGAVYVITGGLGGAGVALAKLLLSLYNCKVALFGRRPADALMDSDWTVGRLSELPGDVRYFQVDASQPAQMDSAIDQIESEWGAIDGVFHLAGAYEEVSILDERRDHADLVLCGKLYGAYATARIFERSPEAIYVAFTSQIGVYGAPGAALYAAANQATDSLVQQLALQGRRAYAVSWTMLQDIGLSKKLRSPASLEALGLLPISQEQMLASLRAILHSEPGHYITGLDPSHAFTRRQMAQTDGVREIDVYIAGDKASKEAGALSVDDRYGVSCRLNLIKCDNLPSCDDRAAARAQLRDSLNTIDNSEMSAIESRVAAIWARVLEVPNVSPTGNFFELGGQSLLATELIAALQKEFGVDWSLRHIFEAPTVREQAQRIEAAAIDTGENDNKTASSQTTDFPLSSAQRRLWFMDRLVARREIFNLVAGARISGPLNLEILNEILAELVDRHDALRTVFSDVDGAPVQRILEHISAEPEFVDFSSDLDGEAERRFRAFVEDLARKPLSMTEGPLFRFTLAKLADDVHELIFIVHHIIADGWSIRIFFSDFIDLYERTKKDASPRLDSPSITYAQYLTSGAHTPSTDKIESDVAYWREKLGGVTSGQTLQPDFPRAPDMMFAGAQLRRKLSKDQTARIQKLAASSSTTLYATLLSIYKAAIYRSTGVREIVVGSVAAKRNLADTQKLFAFLINIIVLKTPIKKGDTFEALLQRVRDTIIDAHEHSDAPFETIVERIHQSKDPLRSAFFQMAFDMHDRNITVSPDPSITLNVMEYDLGTAQYDLRLTFKERDDGLEAFWEYSTALYTQDTIEKFARCFEQILETVADRPETQLAELPDALSEERRRILNEFACNKRPKFDLSRTATDLISAQAAEHPKRIALRWRGRDISYRDFNASAASIAAALSARGVGRGAVVGVCLDRSPEFITAALGVMMAGAAFMPLDPAYPRERILQMLEDARPRVVIASTRHAMWDEFGGAALSIDEIVPSAYSGSGPSADDRAYVIFTSGSTGRPKGVAVRHRALTNLVLAQSEYFEISRESRVIQFAALGFDASISEIFTALCSGAALVLGAHDELGPGAELVEFLERERISVATIPPSILNVLPRRPLPHLKTIVSAGEACSAALVDAWAPGRRFINAYGPTEAAVCASMGVCEAGRDSPPDIGRPIANARLYVLNSDYELAGIGETGELFIGGAGVAEGYVGRPELTSERFVPNPFADYDAPRLYRTGDLARWRDDGRLEYVGRADSQIKHRGFRIEPREIEAAAANLNGVGGAVAALEEDDDGGQALTLYVERQRSNDHELEWWPSIAEFFVYDELMYHLMTRDEARNDAYRVAARKTMSDKVVLDVGTGRDAILARLSVEAGARKVYAVELLEESYRAACETVRRLGLEDRIEVIHGDASTVKLPEPADICISEIVGAIGGSEGAAKIINSVRGQLKPGGLMIPGRSRTLIAAAQLPESFVSQPHMGVIASRYVDDIFSQTGHKFDLRMCVKGARYELLRSTTDIFEDLDYNKEVPLEDEHEIRLEIKQDGKLHGFLIWLTLETIEGEWIDCLARDHCWIPVFVPAFEPAFDARTGDVIEGRVIRTLCENGLNPDFHITGSLWREGAELRRIDVKCAHFGEGFRASPFYRRLFSEQPAASTETTALQPQQIREALRAKLPDFMTPERIRIFDRFPLTSNGKIDRASLGAKRQPLPPSCAASSSSSDLESDILAIWRDVLAAPEAGVDQNFFDLGGHSLKMAMVQARLEQRLGYAPPLLLLFQHPTVRGMARALSENSGGAGANAPQRKADRGRAKAAADRLAKLARRRGSKKSTVEEPS